MKDDTGKQLTSYIDLIGREIYNLFTYIVTMNIHGANMIWYIQEY